jgi:hypothetical protein
VDEDRRGRARPEHCPLCCGGSPYRQALLAIDLLREEEVGSTHKVRGRVTVRSAGVLPTSTPPNTRYYRAGVR